jgi:hypothetical protein
MFEKSQGASCVKYSAPSARSSTSSGTTTSDDTRCDACVKTSRAGVGQFCMYEAQSFTKRAFRSDTCG